MGESVSRLLFALGYTVYVCVRVCVCVAAATVVTVAVVRVLQLLCFGLHLRPCVCVFVRK